MSKDTPRTECTDTYNDPDAPNDMPITYYPARPNATSGADGTVVPNYLTIASPPYTPFKVLTLPFLISTSLLLLFQCKCISFLRTKPFGECDRFFFRQR